MSKNTIRLSALISFALLCLPAHGEEPAFVAPWLELVDADDQVIAPVADMVMNQYHGILPVVRFEISGRPVLLMAFAEGPVGPIPNGFLPPSTEFFREVYYSGGDCTGTAYIPELEVTTLEHMVGRAYGVGRCTSDPAKTCIFEADLATPAGPASAGSSSEGTHLDCDPGVLAEGFFLAIEAKVIVNPTPWRFE